MLCSAAEAKSALASLLTRLRGEKLPEGIVKTNGRIEATQVDVSAKYPGRLAQVMVEEGDSVKEGEVVARIASPEIEAQLKAAKSALQRSKQALAEAEALIATRNSTLTLAKAEMERTGQLLKKGFATQQTFDERQRNLDAATANKQAATAQRDQAKLSSKRRKPKSSALRRCCMISCWSLPAPGAFNINSLAPARSWRPELAS